MHRICHLDQRGRPSVTLEGMPQPDAAMVMTLLDRFARRAAPAEPLCEKLRRNLEAGQVEAEAIERLSWWCHADGLWAEAQPEACEVARAILGVLPPRLLDQLDHPTAAYSAYAGALANAINNEDARQQRGTCC